MLPELAEPHNPSTANRGFTLLETMIALAIISIALVSIYRMHAQTIAMNAAARFYTIAPLLAQGKLAELETRGLADLSEQSGDFEDLYPGYRWTISAEEITSEILGEVAEDLKKIDVSVSSDQNGLQYGFRTYRMVEGE